MLSIGREVVYDYFFILSVRRRILEKCISKYFGEYFGILS